MNTMSHLSPERLAALADEPPTPFEEEHLAACASCARERTAHGALVALAGEERDRPGAALTSWEDVAEGLRSHDLIAGVPRRRFAARQWLEAAAAVLLVGGGAIIGRYSATAVPARTASVPTEAASDDEGVVIQASNTGASPRMHFSSRVEAATTLARAAQEYQAALAFLASQDTLSRLIDSTDVFRTRLATLDAVAATTRQAMETAPYDPVINRYYLTTMGAREATLRQLNNALPADVKLTRY